MLNYFKTLAFVGLALVSLTAANSTLADGTLQRVADFKVLTVGMSGNQPPMNTYNRSGQLMGFDVDLARALAAAMKVKLDIKVLPFGDLMGALDKDEIDMVISGMSITPERTRDAFFVGPYMMSGKSLLTKDSVLARAESSADFNRANLKLVALKNSTSADFARDAAPDAQLQEVGNYDEGVEMVINGEADALIADMPICVLSVLRFPDAGLATLSRPITVEPIGIAVSGKDPMFLNLVQNYVDAYGKSGLLAKLRKKWFEDKGWIAALP